MYCLIDFEASSTPRMGNPCNNLFKLMYKRRKVVKDSSTLTFS